MRFKNRRHLRTALPNHAPVFERALSTIPNRNGKENNNNNKNPDDSETAQVLLGQEEQVLGGPRARKEWEGRRKWLRDVSRNLTGGRGT